MSQEGTERTLFLNQLLADQERGELAPVEDYVLRFPRVAAFVRNEYNSLTSGSGSTGAERYRLERELAKGGMGEVHLATDTVLQRTVVVKTVRPGLVGERATERLQREARVLSRLDHPHVCRILDVIVCDGNRLMLVLPYLQGRTLADCIEAARAQPRPVCVPLGDAPPSLPLLLEWFAKVAIAVDAAHEVVVVHRDLKPSNLFVLGDGAPVVLDFGLAQDSSAEDQGLTRTGEQLGTPLYMAPEQVDGRPCDRRTDVYALGVVLYEALTLRRPFEGDTRQATFRQIMDREPVPPRRHNRAVPRDLEAVCMKAMARDPARRYATAGQFAADLRRVIALEATVARPQSGIGKVVRLVRRRRGPIVVAITAGATALAWATAPSAVDAAIHERVRDAGMAASRHRDSEELEHDILTRSEAHPFDSPTGLALRIDVCDPYYRQLDRPGYAIQLLTRVINALEQCKDWSPRESAAIRGGIVLTLPDRPMAGCREDLLGWAYERRAWIRSSVGLFTEAWCDLEAALPLLDKTGNWHWYVNAIATQAEIRLRLDDDVGAAPYVHSAREGYLSGRMEAPEGLDITGAYAVEVERAHLLRRRGDFAEAAWRYQLFVHHWTYPCFSESPLQLPANPLTDFTYDLSNDCLHSILWYVECALWDAGGPTEQTARWLDYVATHYKNRFQRSTQLHRDYVDLVAEWLHRPSSAYREETSLAASRREAMRTIEKMERIDERWRERDLVMTQYCLFFDGAWLKARVLAKVAPEAHVIEIAREGEQLFATAYSDGRATRSPFDEQDAMVPALGTAALRSYLVPGPLPVALLQQFRDAGWQVRTSLADCVQTP